MFPHYTSLVSPSLARRQVNAVEFAISLVLALRWLRSNSATYVAYEGEIVQRVATQKLVTCIAYRYT